MLQMTTETAAQSRFQAKCHNAVCRACGQRGLLAVLDLGEMPLSDGLLTEAQLHQDEPRYPLEVAYCPGCTLVQILHTVAPEILFGDDYPYFSSFIDTLMAHARANALELIASRKLGRDSLVIELASNDGYLLRNFVSAGIPVLGIDPVAALAEAARKVGVETLAEFFTYEMARRLRDEGKQADVIIANNVLAHVADTNGFVEGISLLLADDGVAVIEVPYVRDLIDRCLFDTIYHEHLCYFSVTALNRLFARHGLYLNDVRRLPIHGGSLRLYLERRPDVHPAVGALLGEEKALGVDRHAYYEDFAGRVTAICRKLLDLLSDLKASGRSIVAYGAAAKGAILLNAVGVRPGMIDYVVDRNVHKQGRYMPGVHIPIVEPERILRDRPDYVLILPWNFKEEILSQQEPYRRRGGKFIIPIPEPVII